MKFTITDGTISTPVPAEPILFEYPIRGSNARLYRRKFYVDLEAYSRLPLDTPSPEHPEMILVDESIPTRVGNTQRCTFVRTYADVPSPIIEYSTVSVTFPGFNSPNAPYIVRRVHGDLSLSWVRVSWRRPFQAVVTLKLHSNFYKTTNPESHIPLYTSYNGLGKYLSEAGAYETDVVLRTQPQENEIMSYEVQNGVPIRTFIRYINTVPALSEYQRASQIVIEPTKIERWNGNIWRATTGWVDAL